MALKVNGEEIQDTLIHEEADRLRPHYQSVFTDQKPEEQEAQLLQWSIENVIERILLQQYARNDARPVAAETIDKAFPPSQAPAWDGKRLRSSASSIEAKLPKPKEWVESRRPQRSPRPLRSNVKTQRKNKWH